MILGELEHLNEKYNFQKCLTWGTDTLAYKTSSTTRYATLISMPGIHSFTAVGPVKCGLQYNTMIDCPSLQKVERVIQFGSSADIG
jgi:hypothetical protein